MSASVSIQYVGYLGATIGVCMVIPQIARTYRNRALGGVSVLSWALSGLSSFTWLLYGVRAAETPQIPGNVLTVSGAMVIALAVPSPVGRSRRAVAIALPAAVLIALAATTPPTALGFVAFGIGIVSMLPQTLRSLRSTGDEVSAVSVLTWILFGVSQACWLIYALVVHDLVVTISACWIMASALAIVSSELRQRRRLTGDDPGVRTVRNRRSAAA
ncbi:MAG: hypothetical protein JWM76_2925 [Pseudonocardiales bacterium]|nr:hypothetical protein [Pseudonocardiales bacterium]